jgi:hypothetical protein
MATRTTAKIVGALAGATVLAASFGAAADARIPEGDWNDARRVSEAAAAVPDAFERAVLRLKATPLATKPKPRGLDASTADAFERAALRRMRS